MDRCRHNEWLRREENPLNLNEDKGSEPAVRLTCRICFRDVTFPSEDAVSPDMNIVGSIADQPKRIVFVHNLRKGTTVEELQFHLNLCCGENDQIEKINLLSEQRYAFVQIKNPAVAARLVRIRQFHDSTLHTVFVSYARAQTPLVTKSLFLIINRVRCSSGGMLPLTPLLLFQIFHHFRNIRKIITLGAAEGVPQKQTKALIELESCTDAEAALAYGSDISVEFEGHDVLDIHISGGKNEEIQNSTNTPSSMILTAEEENMLRWNFPPLERTLVIPTKEGGAIGAEGTQHNAP